jgi:DNA-directed RNA polymerase II subunit RPB2
MGECRNDYGGYFIINGKEKVILSQEKFADNMLYVRKYKPDELYSFSCEVHSVSEDSSKPIRYTSAKIIAPDASYTNNQIVIDIPNVKKPIPLTHDVVAICVELSLDAGVGHVGTPVK